MDYKIIPFEGQLMLLERIEEDTGWQVLLTMYVDLLNRFDEWVPCASAQEAKDYIANFSEGLAQEFMDRAAQWWDKENAF